jgi:phage baseplate assembly protein V
MNEMLEHATGEGREPGLIRGVSVGVVAQNKDPEGLGRVKVQFPWRENPDESHWARIAVPMAGNNRGIWFLPEVGDEVLVACDAERVEHPYVLGSLWNGQEPPPETNSDGQNDIRKIRSRSGHEIIFDDGAQGRIDIHLSDNKRVRMDPDGILISDDKGNEIEIKSLAGTMTIKSNTQISIQSRVIDIKADASMTLQATGTLTIQGALVKIN